MNKKVFQKTKKRNKNCVFSKPPVKEAVKIKKTAEAMRSRKDRSIPLNGIIHKLEKMPTYHEDLIEKMKNPVRARNYLREALALSLEDGDGATFQLALRDVAEAQGGVGVASGKAGMKRENIYRILSKERHPKFDSVLKIAKAVGFHG